MRSKSTTFALIIVFVIVLAVVVSLAASDGGARIGSMPVFAICAMLAFALNWLVFLPSNAKKTEHYYDLTGSVTYIAMVVAALALTTELDVRTKVVAAMVILWACRLGSFLFIRINQDGRDDRFDEIKVIPIRFFLVWTIQALWCLITAACALVIITTNTKQPFGLLGSVGLLMWLSGFVIEVVADRQKRQFKTDPANQGRFISSGLWAKSRHPNYFGEILLWFGVAVMAIPVMSGWQWVALISPIFVTVLITQVSGIPTLRRKANQRWGDDADYQAYLAKTPLLIPKLRQG